ncbi:hypothetical protein HK100_011833 [Physocladia obscura]|uniref:Uncharacterized protein n=1 Tax=Physocladia obscura TaxID=109957 RepID=A0AAD5XKM6_9FUNG|nr:hypothetical protein HK100_011833 [Physocladia obscura]
MSLSQFLDSCDETNWFSRFLKSVEIGGYDDDAHLRCIEEFKKTRRLRDAGEQLGEIVVEGITEDERFFNGSTSRTLPPQRCNKSSDDVHSPSAIHTTLVANNKRTFQTVTSAEFFSDNSYDTGNNDPIYNSKSSTPQSKDSMDSRGTDKSNELYETEFINQFATNRKKISDTTFASSGRVLEDIVAAMMLDSPVQGDKESYLNIGERLIDSCILDLDDPIIMAPFNDVEQLEIRQELWENKRPSHKIFTGDFSQLKSEYRQCDAELNAAEQLFMGSTDCSHEDGADLNEMYDYMLRQPDLKLNETRTKSRVLIGFRNSLKSVESEAVKSEADRYRWHWHVLQGFCPEGITITSPETTGRASKERKLNTEEGKNIRGLQADMSYATMTGVTLSWDEGKVGDWIDNPAEANYAYQELNGNYILL